MRKSILFALILASAFQTALGEQSGDWIYSVENNQATITGYTGAGGAVTIPSSVNGIPVVSVGGGYPPVFGMNNISVTSVTILNGLTTIGSSAFYACKNLSTINIPSSVTSIGDSAFTDSSSLTWIMLPRDDVSIGRFASGLSGTIITPSLLNALANNDAFVTAVANKIKATGGTYGIATQSGLSTAIEPLATKTQITTAINEGKASGIASVTASPNTWSLFTTSQIQNMAVGDLVLTRTNGSNLVLNYDIEQSEDLQTWTTYQGYALPLTNLPTNKAFVRIKAKQ